MHKVDVSSRTYRSMGISAHVNSTALAAVVKLLARFTVLYEDYTGPNDFIRLQIESV